MNYLEIIGTTVGVIYLWLEYRASVWLWVASTVMPAIYLVVFYQAGLYADMAINLYYLIASIYGLVCWMSGRDSGNNARPQAGITHMPRNYWLISAFVVTILFALIGYILTVFTDSIVPWADSFTTSLSIVAMWMLARKYLEQWLVWIAVDLGCCALYAYKELWFTAALYGVYSIIAVAGYRKWKLMMNHDNDC